MMLSRATSRGILASSALLVTILALACAPAPAPDTTEEARAGIQATNARFMELVEAKDAAGLAALYTENARVFPPGGQPVEGRQAIEQLFAGMVQGIGRVQLDTVEVEGHGDTAHEQEALTFYDANGAQIDQGKAIVIWKKVGEEWLLHRDIFNSNMAPAPPADAGAPTEGGEATGATGEASGTAGAEGAPPPPPG